MKITKISKEEFNISKWSGGKTSEIFILPHTASYKKNSFDMRISSATVELETSAFTHLPSVYRFICPLDNKLKLYSNGTTIAELDPFEIFQFSGNAKVTSEGKCRDFNLMLKENSDGYMKTWNTEQETEKNISLKENSLFWIFSYNSRGCISLEETNTSQEKQNRKKILSIEEMQFFKIENTSTNIKLKTNIKTKLLYGVYHQKSYQQ